MCFVLRFLRQPTKPSKQPVPRTFGSSQWLACLPQPLEEFPPLSLSVNHPTSPPASNSKIKPTNPMARKLQSITREMTLGLRLTEARSNYQYWLRQTELRFNPDAQLEAGMRMLAWKQTIAGIEAEIDALQLTPSH